MECAQRLAQRSAGLHQQLDHPPLTWGRQQALDDLRSFAVANRDLAAALQAGVGAEEQPEASLSGARKRLETSKVMLSASPDQTQALEKYLQQAATLEEKIRAYRTRLNGRASVRLAEVDMESAVAPPHYENLEALLVEVRCVRELTLQLRAGAFSGGGPGSGRPNNLDTLRLRELALTARKLERKLSVSGMDIADTADDWEKLRRAYLRVGYIPPTAPGRQLELSMQRLEAFYDSL